MSRKVGAGDRPPVASVTTVSGEEVDLTKPGGFIHLQLRRFAGCPVCNVHLASFQRRVAELREADVRELVVFHSPAAEVRSYAGDFPFDLIADPDKQLYAAFGTEERKRALLDPRAWGTIARAVAAGLYDVVVRGRPMPPLNPPGGRFGQPADILIGPQGRIAAVRYGRHVDDQWSVDELLALVRSA